MSNLVELGRVNSTESLLKTLETLRERVESGEIVAFAAVGLTRDDRTFWWSGSTLPVSRLRIMGAIAHLQACFHADENL